MKKYVVVFLLILAMCFVGCEEDYQDNSGNNSWGDYDNDDTGSDSGSNSGSGSSTNGSKLRSVSILEFIENAAPNDGIWYKLSGDIIDIEDAEYGDFTICDDSGGAVYVYGLTSSKSNTNDKSFSKLGLKVGDNVTLATVRGLYKGNIEAGGPVPAYYISHRKGSGNKMQDVYFSKALVGRWLSLYNCADAPYFDNYTYSDYELLIFGQNGVFDGIRIMSVHDENGDRVDEVNGESLDEYEWYVNEKPWMMSWRNDYEVDIYGSNGGVWRTLMILAAYKSNASIIDAKVNTIVLKYQMTDASGTRIVPFELSGGNIEEDSNGNTGSGGSNDNSGDYETPDIGFYDFTATTSSLKVEYKIYNKSETKITGARIYYGTTPNPSKYINATINGSYIYARITGLDKGTTYYVQCAVESPMGYVATDVTKCITNS